MISPDSVSRQPGLSVSPDLGDGGDTTNSEAAGSPNTRLSGARPRRSPISPLNVCRSSLPHLGEGLKSLADPLRVPVVDEVQPPGLSLELKPPNSDVLRPPGPVVDEIGPSSLASPRAGELSTPDNQNCTSPIEEEPCRAVSPVNASCERPKEAGEVAIVSTVPPSPTTGNTRRPRLQTLRQTSLESFTLENLPEDMSEIELLTGDLHSPVLSTRRPRAPLKKQEVGHTLVCLGVLVKLVRSVFIENSFFPFPEYRGSSTNSTP